MIARRSSFFTPARGSGARFFASPGLVPDVLAMMRAGFDATMKDPEFIAEIDKHKLTLAPQDGASLERLIKRIYATPKSIVERVASLIR